MFFFLSQQLNAVVAYIKWDDKHTVYTVCIALAQPSFDGIKPTVGTVL